MPNDASYVLTQDLQVALRGHETEVLEALKIPWRDGRPHICCPYADHRDDHPSWRWDQPKARAYCTCIERGGHSVFDVVMGVERSEFEAAKVRVAEILGRTDLIRSGTGIGIRRATRQTCSSRRQISVTTSSHAPTLLIGSASRRTTC
jgi:hypothetical protein